MDNKLIDDSTGALAYPFTDVDFFGLPSVPNKNVLLHGPGGTGKTYSLKILLKYYAHRNIVATSLTGVSAIGLNIPEEEIFASTIHRWSGIGLGDASKEKLLVKVRKFKAHDWRTIDILIIDEISMMSKALFEKLDYIARTIRKSDEVFGGIRLIISGDFLQLSPIGGDWIFNSKLWKKLDLHVFNLNEPKRFTSTNYFDMLQRIRQGKVSKEDKEALEARVFSGIKEVRKAFSERFDSDNKIEPTILFSKKADTKLYNSRRLEKLENISVEYESKDSKSNKDLGRTSPLTKYDYKFLDNLADKKVAFKVNAQVMLTTNLSVEDELINGSRGVVTELGTDRVKVLFVTGNERWIEVHKFELKSGKYNLRRKQLPLILSFANTIHKVQGATIDAVVCILDDSIFADAQAYIALSRVRTITDLFLLKFVPSVIKANKEAVEFTSHL